MDANAGTVLFDDFWGFNPRARDGREDKLIREQLIKSVSIHAPVMDAKKDMLLL